MFSVPRSLRHPDMRHDGGMLAAPRRQNVRRGRLQRRSAQNCGSLTHCVPEKSFPAYPTFYLPQRTSRFTMRPGSAQASRRVTDLATAPAPHFPGVGATSFSEAFLNQKNARTKRARELEECAPARGSPRSDPVDVPLGVRAVCLSSRSSRDRQHSDHRHDACNERARPCATGAMGRSFCDRGHRALTTAIYRKLSAIGLTMAQGCAI
jgi:hypothetical protein